VTQKKKFFSEQLTKSVNMSGGFVCSTLEEDPLSMSTPTPTPTSTQRKTPPPSYDESQTLIIKSEKKHHTQQQQHGVNVIKKFLPVTE
jgi:hypothetical protein